MHSTAAFRRGPQVDGKGRTDVNRLDRSHRRSSDRSIDQWQADRTSDVRIPNIELMPNDARRISCRNTETGNNTSVRLAHAASSAAQTGQRECVRRARMIDRCAWNDCWGPTTSRPTGYRTALHALTDRRTDGCGGTGLTAPSTTTSGNAFI